MIKIKINLQPTDSGTKMKSRELWQRMASDTSAQETEIEMRISLIFW